MFKGSNGFPGYDGTKGLLVWGLWATTRMYRYIRTVTKILFFEKGIVMETKNKNSLPKREEIDAKYKWKLEDIYADNSLWEEDFNKVKQMARKWKLSRGNWPKARKPC